MPTPEPPTTISLTVKVPPGTLTTTDNTPNNSSSDHFSLGSFPTSSTIANLRQQIQLTIPTNPPPDRQRILYGGRALVDNDQTLAEALNIKRDPELREYVVHLLVRGEGDASGPRRTPTPGLQQHQQGRVAGLNAAGMNGQQGQGQGPMPPNLNQHQQLLGQHQALIRQLQMQQQQMFHHFTQGVPLQQRGGGGGGQMPMPVPVPEPNGGVQGLAQQQQQHLSMPGWAGMNPTGAPNQPGQANVPQVNGDTASNTNLRTSREQQSQGQDQAQPQNNSTHTEPQVQQNQQPQPRHTPQGQGVIVEGIGPNGQRFQYHQHTMQVPAFQFGNGMPGLPGMPMMGPPHQHGQQGQQMPQVMPMQMPIPFTPPPPPAGGMPANMPFQAFAPPQAPEAGVRPPPANAPSALDRARQNIAEMRRMLDELANENSQIADADAGTEERGRRINDIQVRARSVNEYIDPLGIGTVSVARSGGGEGRETPTQQANGIPAGRSVPVPMNALRARFPQAPAQMPLQQSAPAQQVQPPSNPNEVTAYLLSSPQGPHAVIFSPQHGTHTTIPRATALSPPQQEVEARISRPTPTQTANHLQQPPQQVDPIARAAQQAAHQPPHDANAAQPAQQQQANQDPLNNIQPLLNHFWLLLRILIFSYFLLGGNLGWQRPLLLLGIGVVFAVLRMGVLGGNARLDNLVAGARGWWEGVVGVPQRRVEEQAGQGQEQGREGVEVPQQQREGNAGGAVRAQAMPTPQQAAQRILNAQAVQQEQQRTWLRERIRPVERALALFVASLWPGIGEAHVREQRRLREEEEVERRRVEDERAEGARAREEGGGGEKAGERSDEGGKDEKQGSGGNAGEGSVVVNGGEASSAET